MTGACCGRSAARVTVEGVKEDIEGPRESIEAPSGAEVLERDPNCACDPCIYPSDDVPCNARYLGDDLSDQGLQQALDELEWHVCQVQAAQGDGCKYAGPPPRPPVEERGSPERPGPAPTEPSPAATPITIPAVSVQRRPGVLPFPPEIRNIIYEFYFAGAIRPVSEIAAVRVRRDEAGSDTRIRRYLRNVPRERRRFVLDHRHQNERPKQWRSFVSNADREMAAITYEIYADNDALQRLHVPSDPFVLLRVSRETRREASPVFFRSFRFIHPRDLILDDYWVHHGILAAETFLTDQPETIRRQIIHILGATQPVRGGPTSDTENSSLIRYRT